MRLRLRWHHANDLMFLLQLNIMFFGFSQLKAPDVDTSFGIFSLVMAILAILAWLAWIFFILRKISKHKIRIIAGLLERNLTTFYQGMLPVSRLGVFFQFLFYCRRCMEAALIGLAGTLPLYVLPVLLLSSVFVILLILYYRPFLLPVHNFVTIAAEGILMVIYIIITVITYNDTYLTNRAKFALGWIAVVLGVFLILALCLFLVVKLVDPEFFDALSQDELEFKKEQLLNEENMRGKNELQNGDDDGDIDDESELNSDEESSVGYDFSRRGVDGFHRNFIHYS